MAIASEQQHKGMHGKLCSISENRFVSEGGNGSGDFHIGVRVTQLVERFRLRRCDRDMRATLKGTPLWLRRGALLGRTQRDEFSCEAACISGKASIVFASAATTSPPSATA